MDFEKYAREGRALYADFACAVASVVASAVEDAGGLKLQQVQARAKDVDSLRDKLAERELSPTADVTELKDLAGCRAIFYTNTDVERFLNSGLVEANFEIIQRRLHHPHRQVHDAADLYTANHYVLRFTDARASLPEYRRFAGLKCELQIQTILNHSWAATAHDTIYKAPELQRFGTHVLSAIERRLARIAKEYLVPAGYEFDRVFHDFDRLVAGKALLDDNALGAIIQAPDNNERLAALETFGESVLPFYDDIKGVYPEVSDTLIKGAQIARETAPVERETPFGSLPATSFADVLRKIEQIFRRYRYVDINRTFSALCDLWKMAQSEEERKPLYDLADAMGKHDLSVWQRFGPAAQESLVEAICELPEQELLSLVPLIARLLTAVLGAEVRGTTSSSSTVTIHTGATPASARLETVRSTTLDILEQLTSLSLRREERASVEDALLSAAIAPYQGNYGPELALIVMTNTKRVLEILTRGVADLPFQGRQSLEAKAYRVFRMNQSLPPGFKENEALAVAQAQVRKAALALRDAANADPEFELYKVLVGYNSVYPGAWEREALDWRADQAYREQQASQVQTSVNSENGDLWFQRLSRFAATDSNDLATFPVLGEFINNLGETQPDIVLEWLNREGTLLDKFLPAMLSGLMRSARRADTEQRMNQWIEAGENLSNISWYARFSEPFDESLLERTLRAAIQQNDAGTIRNCVDAAVRQYEKHPGSLINKVFIPAIQAMSKRDDASWINAPMTPWMGASLLLALDRAEAKLTLAALIQHPRLEHDAEYIVAAIAKPWPELVVEFLSRRLAFKKSGEAPAMYDAIPFQVFELRQPLAAIPDLLVRAAQEWYKEDPYTFQFDGGRLLSSVFPELVDGLSEQLEALADQEASFVLAVLGAYEGKSVIYDLVRRIVSCADPTSAVWRQAHDALDESGVVMGEFGFADLCDERRKELAVWLTDDNSTVREFAREHLENLELRSLAETKRAEAMVAHRKMEFDEPIAAEPAEDVTA